MDENDVLKPPTQWKEWIAKLGILYVFCVVFRVPLSLSHRVVATVDWLGERDHVAYEQTYSEGQGVIDGSYLVEYDFQDVDGNAVSIDEKELPPHKRFRVGFDGTGCFERAGPGETAKNGVPIPEGMKMLSKRAGLERGDMVSLSCKRRFNGRLFSPRIQWLCDWWCHEAE